MDLIRQARTATGTGLRGSGRVGSLVAPPTHFDPRELELAQKHTQIFTEPRAHSVMLEGGQLRPATLRCGELIPYTLDEIAETKATDCSDGKTVHIFRGVLKPGTTIRDGPGSFHYGNGEVFEGRWKNNMRHGLGALYLPSGYAYEGNWQDDKPNGRGVETFPFGEKYVGNFVNGKPHGRGTMFYVENGSRFEGSWEAGEKHGPGVMYYDNGDVFQGTWRRGKREGSGIITYAATGKSYMSWWESDECDRKRGTRFVAPRDVPEVPPSEAPKYDEIVSPLGGHLPSFKVVPDLWTEVHPAHFARIKRAFEALDHNAIGEIEMTFLQSIWDPNNMETLETLEKAATTVGADDTLELIEMLTGLYPHLPSSETRRWVITDLPIESLLKLRGMLGDATSAKGDGFYSVTDGEKNLTLEHVQQNKGMIGGVRVSRAMFNRNKVLHDTEFMTFPQMLAQMYPNLWKESLLRCEVDDIPPTALLGYATAFDALDDDAAGYLALEKMKKAQSKFQSSIANGHAAITMPLSSYERHIVKGFFKHQGRWLLGDISLTVTLVKQIDKSRTGFVSFAEILRYSFPNVACMYTRERLGVPLRADDFCQCCICRYATNRFGGKPRPPSPYLDGGATW